MKKVLFFILCLCSLTVAAQDITPQESEQQADSVVAATLTFAYLSYDSVLYAMPAYAEMKVQMAEMSKEYEAEMKRVEDDFNKKYEQFLDVMKSSPETILQKRQSELQEILNKNIEFKKASQKLLKDTEAKMLGSLKANIQEVVNSIALERGYAFVLNMDETAVTFINPGNGVDITADVKAAMVKE